MRKPAEVFSPGEFIRDELEERGWTQGDLAARIGRPLGLIDEVIGGTRRISLGLAHDFADAFGTTPELWLNLDAAYQASRTENDTDDPFHRRIELASM